jgi:hypothetical protein
VGIASTILVAAGVLILFLINLIFAIRVLRAAHPHLGWHKTVSTVTKVLYALIVVMLAMIITATVQSFYTLSTKTHTIDRDLQLTAMSYFLFISFLPIVIVILGFAIPRKTRLEKFGSGRWRTKIAILLTTSVLLCLGASFRAATNYKNPRPRDDPAWYDAKWCFYFFNFTVEIVVVFLYIVLRVDRRFHIPDGSKGPGDYVSEQPPKEKRHQTPDMHTPNMRRSMSSMTRVLSEEEVFDDASPARETTRKDGGGQV